MGNGLSTGIFSLLFLLVSLVGCNGVDEQEILDKLKLADNSLLDIDPSTKLLYPNQTQQYVVSGGKPPYVFSLVDGIGSIDSLGLYTAPSSRGMATVRVTDSLGVTKNAVLVVEFELALSPSARKLNVNSSFQFSTTGGTSPYTYSVTSGSSTISTDGTFTGAATAEIATVTVVDSEGKEATATVDVGNGPIISPTTATSLINSTFQFSSTSGTAPFSWTIITGEGSVNGTGLFSATATAGPSTVRVTDSNGYYSEAIVSVFKPNVVAAGTQHVCVAIGDTNEVKCWGQRSFGATGEGKYIIGDEVSDMGDNLLPVKFPPDLAAEPTIIATAYSSGCAIFSDGLTRCWGYSGHGQNGNNSIATGIFYGTTEGYILPVPADIGNPIVDLARKSQSIYHHCGVYQDGTLKCWGQGTYGQLGQDATTNLGGNLTTLSLYDANPIDLGQAVTKVETGYLHTCAILADANVKCWGYNLYGQLGTGNTTNKGTAAAPMSGVAALDFATDIIDLALADHSTCVLTAAGGVKCWGHNTYGILGLGNNVHYGGGAGHDPTALADIPLGTGRTATKIDAGVYHACALLDNGAIKCWGYNTYGQLGLEDPTHRGNLANQLGDNLPAINLGTGRTATDIFVGGHSTCAKLDNGDVKCWGRNYYGNLGVGLAKTIDVGDDLNEMGDELITVNLGTSASALQVSPMTTQTCALVTENGANSVKCFGTEANGVLGIENGSMGDAPGELGSYAAALDLGTSKTISNLFSGGDSNCALFSDGTAKCWGNNHTTYRVIGTGSTMASIGDGAGEMGANLSYMVAGGGLTFKKIQYTMAGPGVACVILSNDALKCIGYTGYGILGQSTNTVYNYISSTPAIDWGAGNYTTDVSLGVYHACAVISDGTLKCWGNNLYGQLGLDHTTHLGGAPTGAMKVMSDIPAAGVDLGTGVVPQKVCSGYYHNCMVDTTGKVKCWGYNNFGQLGVEDTVNRGTGAIGAELGDALPFVNLGTGRTVKEISCGYYHNCAILDNDKLKCWGYNGTGSLGLGNIVYRGNAPGSMGDSLPYVDLGTDRTVQQISVRGHHSCAVLDNNDVKCWGYNLYGQLAKGNTQNLGDNPGEMGDSLIPIALD